MSRILYVTDGFSPYVVGGMQAVARRHMECLHQGGHEVVSISSGPDESARPPKGDLSWENHFIPWPQRNMRQALSPWRYVDDLKRFSKAVLRVIDRIEPDCIYSEGPLVDAYLGRSRIHRRPVIFHPHGLEMFQFPLRPGMYWEFLKVFPMRGLMRQHATMADLVVSQSKQGQLYRIIRHRLGVEKVRIASLPNAVPADQPLAPAPRTAGPAGRFLFIGRNEARKGLPLLLKAFGRARQSQPAISLDVVGWDGAGFPLQPGVRFHGTVRDRQKVQAFYRQADFLVLPSYAEGMPTVILEAFAAALPVIGTDVGAVADLVKNGETGYLVPPGNLVALTAAVNDAARITETRFAELSGRCLELARGSYSVSAVCERLGCMIEKLSK